jgi:hypothetical protein
MPSTDLRIYRVASLTLANAMLFQELLSQRVKVKTLHETVEASDLVGEFNNQWRFIENEIDFAPIFKVAREILLTLPASPETDAALRRLAESAMRISGNRAALRHDLMGRIFHKLLADAKFYGAFYTKIPAATLLLKLTIDGYDWPIDWTDPVSIKRFHIADLACGTGTLLKAGIAAIEDRHIKEAVSHGIPAQPDEVHRVLIENSLWGFDVLSSAIHLAAAAIAMHNPKIAVKVMRLYALPLGGPSQKLGSIEFAQSRKLHVQRTLIGASIGAEEAITRKKVGASIPALSICTMNPPFTRSVYGNLLFGAISETERGELQARLGDIVKEKELEANITAGLGSVFTAIADRMMSKNGTLALVLPKAVLAGSSWMPTRSIFSEQYDLQYAICSHDPDNWNFSESTDLSETLLVLRKGKSKEPYFTKFINLWYQPRTSIEALAVAEEIKRERPANLDSTAGTCELRTNGRKFGEMSQLSLGANANVSWTLPLSFAQTELCRVAYYLSQGRIFLPGTGEIGKIETTKLATVARLGPDGRDIYDGFSLTNTHSPYAAFWGHEAENIQGLIAQPNQYLNPLTEALPRRHLRDANLLWSRAGTLMLPKELWLSTNHVSAVVLSAPALSNVWWPTKWTSKVDEERFAFERRLALWFNSTLGLFSMLMQRQETRGPWVKFPKTWYEEIQILDLNSLTQSQLNMLDDLWQRVNNQNLLPFPEIANDEIRRIIDDTFSDVLDIPHLTLLRNLLAQEPVISERALT